MEARGGGGTGRVSPLPVWMLLAPYPFLFFALHGGTSLGTHA